MQERMAAEGKDIGRRWIFQKQGDIAMDGQIESLYQSGVQLSRQIESSSMRRRGDAMSVPT
jgi:hypothetical protein